MGSRRSADPESKKGEKAARKIGRRPEQGGAGADPESEKGSGGAQFRPHVLGIGRSAA